MLRSMPDRVISERSRRADVLRGEPMNDQRAKPVVLVVEDEPALLTLLRYNLEAEGYRVVEAVNGEEALVKAREETPDLVLLDWMLPLVSGIEVCRQIRRMPDLKGAAIIMLTAKGEEADKIRGLETGADDYVTKPFSPSELMARAKAALRRARPQSSDENLTYADLSMDLATHRVRRSNRDLHLGPTEFRLLKFLMENQGRVFSREQLLDHVWGRDIYVEPRTVDVHIRRLRKAINLEGMPDLIRTVRSAGYALDIEG
jgi:two-component system phosphate regulon response regulator PhoB